MKTMYQGGRTRGKSIAMIMAASKEGAVMFCANEQSQKRAHKQAESLGVTIKTIVSNR